MTACCSKFDWQITSTRHLMNPSVIWWSMPAGSEWQVLYWPTTFEFWGGVDIFGSVTQRSYGNSDAVWLRNGLGLASTVGLERLILMSFLITHICCWIILQHSTPKERAVHYWTINGTFIQSLAWYMDFYKTQHWHDTFSVLENYVFIIFLSFVMI